jgi:NADPH-dependent F420 reductase
MGRIAILGGTGPEGLGLGMRLTLAGEEVVIGSRRPERAARVAEEGSERLRSVGCTRRLLGAENGRTIAGADLIVLSFPYSGVRELLPQLAAVLAGKVILDLVNPLVLEKRVFRTAPLPAGSAGEEIQSILSESQVVSGFKNQSAEELRNIEKALRGDVVVCGDHPEATARVLQLIARIPRVRGVDAGALVNARSLEAITALLLNLNRRHRAITSIEILGLPPS